MSKNPYAIQSILKSLRLLEAIGWKSHDVTLSEIASELHLPKTTTFRHLQTLSAAGFLRHDTEHDRYGIGPRVQMFAQSKKSLSRLRQLATPQMDQLLKTFGGAVNVAVSSGFDIVYVEMLRDSRTAKMQARIGDHHPIHSTALGKAILAFLPPAERAMILDWPLQEVTCRTIRSSAVLRRQIEEARVAGYSMEREEMEDGFSCIGVPILDHDRYPLAAMSLSVTDKRLMTVLADAVKALENAAHAISTQL